MINLSVGEPDFTTPDHIKEAAKKAVDDNFSFYSPVPGYMSLRQAISDKLKNENNLDFTPEQIVVGNGAKQSLCNTVLCLVNHGDEVIIPTPAWVSYVQMVNLCGGKSVLVPATIETDFKITPEQLENAITEKSKLIILCSPSNPTGSIYSKEELAALAEVLARHPQVMIIADEIYEHINYVGKHESLAQFPELKDRVAVINGVSKAYAMTGWRIGYTACDAKLAKVMSNYLSHATSAPSTISQWAAIEALTGEQESVEAMRKVFEERRSYMAGRINELPGVSCLLPEGAFYIMMNIDALVGKTLGGKVIHDGGDFAMAFLEAENVALVPCAGFGEPNYLRWTYAAGMEDIRRGLDRLAHFLGA